MTLYEINQAMLDLVDPETGELLDFEAFTELGMARQDKIENMALWAKDLDAEVDAIKNEIANLTKRKTVAENKAKRLRQYIGVILNGEKFKTSRCVVSYHKSESVNVANEDLLLKYLFESGNGDMVKTEYTISKTGVKHLLKSGEAVPGATLEEKTSTVIK